MNDATRYARQTLLPDVGEAGQRSLRASTALIVGCGALGTHAAESLARAGVGRLVILDRDVVELSNLQRQSLFDEADARDAAPKAVAARRRLHAINSEVEILPLVEDLHPDNARALLESLPTAPAVILDCTDNFDTRYLLNDLAIERSIPLIYAGVVAARAMQMTILPAGPAPTPCLRCVFPDPPAPGEAETCDTAGVLGPAASLAAALQAAEAVKILAGRADLVRPTLHTADLFEARLSTIELAAARDPDCPACAHKRFDFLDATDRAQTALLCGRNSVQIRPGRTTPDAHDSPTRSAARLDLDALAERLAPHADVEPTPFLLRATLRAERSDEGDPVALTIFPDGRAIVGGVADPARARSLYARYVSA